MINNQRLVVRPHRRERIFFMNNLKLSVWIQPLAEMCVDMNK